MIFMGCKVIVYAAIAPHKNRDIFLGIKDKKISARYLPQKSDIFWQICNLSMNDLTCAKK